MPSEATDQELLAEFYFSDNDDALAAFAARHRSWALTQARQFFAEEAGAALATGDCPHAPASHAQSSLSLGKQQGAIGKKTKPPAGQKTTRIAIRGNGRWKIPVFQFQDKELVPNIGVVNAALSPTIDPVSMLRWYRAPDTELDSPSGVLCPLDWLRLGLDPATVAKIARDI